LVFNKRRYIGLIHSEIELINTYDLPVGRNKPDRILYLNQPPKQILFSYTPAFIYSKIFCDMFDKADASPSAALCKAQLSCIPI
jgi:hypothetical protein